MLDCFLQGAEFVHQSQLLGGGGYPHAALGYAVDVGNGDVAPLRHLGDELPVAAVDAALEHGRERHDGYAQVGIRVGGHLLGRHTDVPQQLLTVRNQAEDADGAGDGERVGKDVVGLAAYPVAAGGRVVAHGDDDGLALGLEVARR